MNLYIAEKPSMAGELARCLNGGSTPQKKDGCYTVGTDVVTWAYGHILRQCTPIEYDPKYKKWKEEDLPIVPKPWKFVVAADCQAQFDIIKNLTVKADVIINAGDPDREGQLLIDEILEYLHIVGKKPIKRILMNALDDKSIRTALNDLRDNRDFLGLRNSAYARSLADWLTGMNLSRAYTLAARKAGYQQVLPIGRVKTPTVALVAHREREITSFTPTTHYRLKIAFQHALGMIQGTLQTPDTLNGLDSEGRILNKDILIELAEAIKASTSITISDYNSAEKQEAQRLPYSLSALQVDSGKKYGYGPQTVLDTAQSLYEKKYTSYPRSDCDYLPANQHSDAAEICAALQQCDDCAAWLAPADIRIKSRAWNDSKITAHHAIIPTRIPCALDALTETERNIYLLIAKAYIAQFYPVHIYRQTKITITANAYEFATSGRMVVQSGWRDLYTTEKAEEENKEEENELPLVAKGDPVAYFSYHVTELVTKPPKRFTASTLLAAMKNIHQFVSDGDLKKKLKAVSGIGTEATRATIIKDLLDRQLLTEQKKQLYPAETANLLVDILPTQITSPDTTALWEDRLNNMIEQPETLDEFLADQISYITQLCGEAQRQKIKPLEGVPVCPDCGAALIKRKSETKIFWGCSAYPTCKAAFSDSGDKPLVRKCDCGKGYLQQRKGKKGVFWSCSDWQNCKITFADTQGKPGKKN